MLTHNIFDCDLLAGHENVHRAALVAFAGGFTIQLLDPGNEKDTFVKPRISAGLLTKHISLLVPELRIARFEADITIELSNPPFDAIIRPRNISARLKQDVELLRGRRIYGDLLITKSAGELLRTSYDRLGLTIDDTFTAMRIANVIASIDSDIAPTKVDACHIAEAINYLVTKYEKV